MWQPISPFSNIFLSTAIAVIPLLWIFAGMLKFKLPAHKTSIIALIIAIAAAFIVWHMPADLIAGAAVEGAMLGFWPIIWVIFTAILTYNISVDCGGMDKIKIMLWGISPDRRVQALVLAFAFGGFLEAVAGFGTAVAIPASILVAMGFEPVFAAVVCLVANTVPVALGVVGIPVIMLQKVTGLPLDQLTVYTALQLLPFALPLPFFIVALTAGGIKGIKGVIAPCLVGGGAFGLSQTLVAWSVGPELSAVVGSISALGALVLWLKFFPVKKSWHFPGEKAVSVGAEGSVSLWSGIKAWSPYTFMLVLILMTRLVPGLQFLSKYPFEQNLQFYFGPGGKPVSFSLVTNPGTLILVAAILGALLQGYGIKLVLKTSVKTVRQMGRTIATVLSIVALARIMGYSGMVSAMSASLSTLTGSFYPLISPLIGAIGTFITGSDTSSNVLFGELQKQTAIKIGADPSWIAAANASGATAGKMVSPQSIVIATTATGLSGQEGKILSRTMKYAGAFVILIGILVYAFAAVQFTN